MTRGALFLPALLLVLLSWVLPGVVLGGGGHNLVFVRNGDIWIATSEGGNPRRLTHIGHAANPALSPDGKQVSFSGPGRKTNRKKIFVMPVQGGKMQALNLPNIDYADDPSFSPDSRQLLLRGRTSQDNNH